MLDNFDLSHLLPVTSPQQSTLAVTTSPSPPSEGADLSSEGALPPSEGASCPAADLHSSSEGFIPPPEGASYPGADLHSPSEGDITTSSPSPSFWPEGGNSTQGKLSGEMPQTRFRNLAYITA